MKKIFISISFGLLLMAAAASANTDVDLLKSKLSSLAQTKPNSAEEDYLINGIGNLAQKLKQMTITKTVRRHMARGEAYVEGAKDIESYKRAAKEFELAVKAAPWLASAYYNLGIVQDKSGLYDQAVRHLKLYLAIAPNSEDATEVENLIFKIEVRKEEKARIRIEEKESRHKQTEQILAKLIGKWFWEDPGGNRDYYNIVVIHNDRFEMKYTHTVNAPGIRRNPASITDIIEASLEGNQIFGKKTYLWDYPPWPGCRHQKKTFNISGRVSNDGNTIVIIETYAYDYGNCRWNRAETEIVKTFKKH